MQGGATAQLIEVRVVSKVGRAGGGEGGQATEGEKLTGTTVHIATSVGQLVGERLC